jgi:2-polyprenyl-3-methyl-5-hydroxy-6-metoxy-1,4-benzoquinol methylase
MTDFSDERLLLDRVAARYDGQKDFDRYFSTCGAELILQDFRGRSLVEVGCGSGVMTRLFSEHVEDLTLVDGSARCLAALKAELDSRAHYHATLAEEFMPSQPVDGVVLASVLEHVEDPIALLRHVRQWLKPEGQLFVIVPNAHSLHREVGVAMGLLPQVHAFSERDVLLGHRRIYDIDLLRSHLNESGYHIESCRGIMLKVVSNAQLEAWPPALVRGLLAVGLEYPEIAAQIYLRCTPSTPTDGLPNGGTGS